MIRSFILTLAMLPGISWAAELEVSDAMVPVAPPGVMAHAGFLILQNTGETAVSIVGVSAKGYAMAHIHQSSELNGVATMSSVDQLELAPGQTVRFEHGGLHIMLMRPERPKAKGDVVDMEFSLSDGSIFPFKAAVMPMGHDS